MIKKSLLLTLLLALLVPWAANAQTLTVHDGSGTNNYVPFYGYYADEDQTNQMIYPATELADMNGKAITEMVFYWQEGSYYGSDYGVGTWTVSLGETTATTLSGLDNTTSLTPVFTGVLDEAGGLFDNTAYTLTIAFDDQYVYGGGNLLVQFSHTGTGEYEYYAFEGESVTGASYCYDSQRNFLPKTTFSYSTPSSCAKPENLTLNYTEGNPTATVTWESTASNFNVDINGTVTAINKKTYTFNVTPATNYTVKVQADCGGGELSGWTSTSFFSGCTGVAQLPYSYGFENVDEIDCWTVNATGTYSAYTGVGANYPRTGTNSFMFYYTTNPPQYLISPEFSGYSNGLHVEFWYRQYTNGVETFKVGYSSTTTDDSAFTWGEEITASTTYQRFSANYPAGTKYVAVKHTSDDQYYLFLDDFLFEESASCLEPTNVVASNETTTGATLNWTAGGEETMWDIYVTDDATVVPNDGTTPTYANVTTKPYPITGLTPATTYYAYVRAKCGAKEASAWSSPAIFNTDCVEKALPYSYDFEDSEFDICWSTINTYTSYNAITIMAPSSSSSNHVLAFYRGSSTGTLVAVSPEISASYPLNGYQITFDACYANGTGGSMTAGKLGIGIITDPTDFTTFELIEEIDITDGYSTFGTHTVMFNSYTGSGQYIAIQDIHTQNGYVLVDNIAVTELPACLPPTGVTVNDGLNAVVSWTGSAASYDIAFSDDPTVDPGKVIVGSSTTNSFNLYEVVTLTEGDYTVWVRANCGTNGYSDWVSTSFHLGYCTPNPTSHDGKGITAVSFGTGTEVVNNGDGSASIPASSPYYGDYSSMIGAIPAGVPSTIAITTGTGSYPYTFVIWVDLDKDLSFEDSEILYVGKASFGDGTLNAEITIPGTQTLGDYRMRIYGADSYFTSFYNSGTPDYTKPHDPCADGTWRHANDYTVRVTEAPACLAPTGLDADNITSESADLSWTANSGETAWTIYYKKTSETKYTDQPVSTNPYYTLEGLDAASDYEYYVVANCTSSDESDPSSVYYFTTKCDLITTLPWSEDFESYSTGNFNETCWVNEHIAGSATYVFQVSSTTLGTNNTKKLQLPDENDGNMIKLVLPGMTLPNSNYAFFIDVYRSSNYSTYTTEGIRVFASTNGEIEGATELAFIPRVYSVASGIIPAETTADSWYTYALPINMSGTCYIILRGESKYGASTYMDNFMVASCYPVGTLSYDNLASQTVDLHWTLVDATQDAWQVCINGDEANLIDIDESDVVIEGVERTYSMSGLTAETPYTVKVRANCGGGDFGKWSNTINFTTFAACATPIDLATSNLTMVGADLAWTGSSDVDYYTVQYRTAAYIDTPVMEEDFSAAPSGWLFRTGVLNTDGTATLSGTSSWSRGTSNSVLDGQHMYMNMYSTKNWWLITPSMTIADGYVMNMDIAYTPYSNSNPLATGCTTHRFAILISTDDMATWTILREWNNSGSPYVLDNVSQTGENTGNIDLSAYAGETAYIAFFGHSEVSDYDNNFHFDNVSIGSTNAAGSWQTAANDVTAWNYELAGLTASVKYDARVYANCAADPETENDMTTFTTLADGNIVFPDEGNWAAGNFEPTGAPAITDDVIIRANVTVPNGTNALANNINLENSAVITVAAGATLTINGTVTNGVNASIIIEDGGQLIHTNAINATAKKNIAAYTAKDGDGWYLITTPVSSTATSVVAQGTYDLFKYNEPAAYWYSSTGSTSPFSYLYRNTGYLYANAANQTLNFAGSMQATNTAVTMNLSYTSSLSTDVRGFNLVGNPFTRNLVKGDVKWGTETNIAYLTMNDTRTDFQTFNINDRPILVGEGFFFQATEAGQTLVFNAPSSKSDNGYIRIVAGNENGSDNAYINVANGNTLHKFNIANGTKVYVLNGGEAYSAARIEELAGSMPVNFKAAADGEYTITINAMNLEANMMILLDKFTGAEIDLLESPTYNFKATTTDDENRFKIIFDCNYTGLDENYADATFVFQSDNDLIVHGEGMLNIYDVLGRLVASYQVNGNKRLSVSTFNTGVYIFKLIGENAQTQKIVVR